MAGSGEVAGRSRCALVTSVPHRCPLLAESGHRLPECLAGLTDVEARVDSLIKWARCRFQPIQGGGGRTGPPLQPFRASEPLLFITIVTSSGS